MISIEMSPPVSFLLHRYVMPMIPAAFFESDPPEERHTPLGLRAPEQIFGDSASKAADIWAFGILVFEFVCGCMVFEFGLGPIGRENVDDEHLLMLSDWIGPLPENLHQRWSRSSKYFTPERVLYNTIVTMDSWDYLGYEPDTLDDNRMDPMEKQFDEYKPTSVSAEEEGTVIKALIRRTLQYDPAKRPTACELLQDPWFTTDFERILTEEVFPYAANFTSLC